jgi:rSAM/selenodomain-associated transferase 2
VKISIIIPVLNEQHKLAATLECLQEYRQQGHEVIVVDGGSSDNTQHIARQAADTVVESLAGRARQMNAGAAKATGQACLFLHADTVLPKNALQLISSLNSSRPFWGRFDIRLSSNRKIFRLIEYMVNLRSRLTFIATGDQAIFIESDLFKNAGGYPDIALMEDIAISRILKKQLRPVCFKDRVVTSSRRWETKGVLATILLMWKLRLYYFFGVSPERLSKLYR